MDDVYNFTTGPTSVPNIGRLEYEGCTFGPLFETQVSGKVIKDSSQRTTKYIEYEITADGYVTLNQGNETIAPSMLALHRQLSQQGGRLDYSGKGFDLLVNGGGFSATFNVGTTTPNSVYGDVAWGPSTEVLDFQPLGSGRSAKIVWRCKVRITHDNPRSPAPVKRSGPPSNSFVAPGTDGKLPNIPLLEFNYETVVTYKEDNSSAISMNGSLEIPMTRPGQFMKKINQTADDMRVAVESRLMSGIDLSVYAVAHREFKLSRDKRTLDWTIRVEEKPYMDMPIGCGIARGTFQVKPANSGMGLVQWLCSLRVTYDIRSDEPRRLAWLSFLALLRHRMLRAKFGSKPADPPKPPPPPPTAPLINPGSDEKNMKLYIQKQIEASNKAVSENGRAFIVDLNIDEGLYKDSRTVTFSASWRLVTLFSHILVASGLWTKLPEKTVNDKSIWALSMRDVQGVSSWLSNKADPAFGVIVDFGG